ncbi:lysosome-associated membrane glycoprotein 2 isoform X1 [Synchiropus splendidus]|uniref:lysosome-associated membrane glycoprotein 2 isoform X1 n=2 Tax=Synchiropus splendidus TaxID=270530 RepID=UPI00237DE463|nr:lysosome-associated membrane glycoprotein 2 isoform X1 [Synchiropus splendidus]
MSRFSAFILLLMVAVGVHQSSGVEVKVNDKNGTLCLSASLMVNFSISYETTDKMMAVVEIELPSKVSANDSVCGSNSSVLKLEFESGHSWTMNFITNGKTYEADSIIFSYNLGDSKVFPNSSSNDTLSVTVKPHIIDVDTDTSYSCKSSDMIQAKSVNQTLWNVVIQAFITNGQQSTNYTSCAADTPTAAPTKPPVTTPSAPTTPVPTPTLPDPAVGKYNVTPENSTACLLAQFGLRLGIKLGGKYEEMNLNSSKVSATGGCNVNSSELVLESDTMNIKMTFTNDTKKFRLHAFEASGTTSSGAKFSDGNSSLSLWEASVGNSYMCNKEQNYTITEDLFVFTFQLQIQPVGVKKGAFSTAEECVADGDNFLVPIAVGVALLVLILIVLLAYFIGRKRNMASGYESF